MPFLGQAGMSSLLGNLFSMNNSSSNTSGSSATAGNTNSNTSGTSSNERILAPGQSDLLQNLMKYSTSAMTNPSSLTAPFQTAARDQVNNTYSGLGDSLRQQFLSTGGGSSGKYGMALAQGNAQRLGGLSNVDSTFAQTNAMLPLQIANSLGTNLLNYNLGSTTTGNQSTTGSSTQQSNQNQNQNSSSTGFKI